MSSAVTIGEPRVAAARARRIPRMLRARAEQQGLLDASQGAAACDPRILAAMAACVERVNRALPEDDVIVAWSIAGS